MVTAYAMPTKTIARAFLSTAETDFLHGELLLNYVNDTEIYVKYTKRQRK
jgi:hypothetical protein